MEQSSMTVKLPHKLLEYSSAFMNDLTENLSVHQISTRSCQHCHMHAVQDGQHFILDCHCTQPLGRTIVVCLEMTNCKVAPTSSGAQC